MNWPAGVLVASYNCQVGKREKFESWPLGDRLRNWSTSWGSSLIWGIIFSSFICKDKDRKDTHKWQIYKQQKMTKNVNLANFHLHFQNSHLDAFALVVTADCSLSWGGSSGRGHSRALGCLGPLTGGQRERESGEEGRSLTQEAVNDLVLLHGPLGWIPVGLCCRTGNMDFCWCLWSYTHPFVQITSETFLLFWQTLI